MSKKKKKNKKKIKFGCDVFGTGDNRPSSKTARKMKKQMGGLTPTELYNLYSKVQLTETKATVLNTRNYYG